jgi:glycosyltransferase involved in cell wall biosynthesis
VKTLLFVTPVLPAPTGFGLAMRAGLFLDALSDDFDVTVLVVPVVEDIEPSEGRSFVASRARELVVAHAADYVAAAIGAVTDPARRARIQRLAPLPVLARGAVGAADALAGRDFDVVHVTRLYLAPAAEPWLGRGAHVVIDLDDDEVASHDSPDEAAAYARLEAEFAACADGLIVSADDHAARLRLRVRGADPVVVPNAVDDPGVTVARGAARDVLFVGNMTYEPNADAAELLCREILPEVSLRVGRPVTATIAGRADRRVLALRPLAGVHVAGFVADVRACYRDHAIAALPLRTGTGTSIKAVEAFAHRRPVVSTSVGVRGLGVEAGVHAAVADDPAAFAEAGAELLRDPAAAARMAERGYDLFRSRFDAREVRARIARLYAGAHV